MGDTEIRRAVKGDPDAAPIAPKDWFERARLVEPRPKMSVSIRLDKDVIKWFKNRGRGYQTRINAVLRAYVESQAYAVPQRSPVTLERSGRRGPRQIL